MTASPTGVTQRRSSSTGKPCQVWHRPRSPLAPANGPPAGGRQRSNRPVVTVDVRAFGGRVHPRGETRNPPGRRRRRRSRAGTVMSSPEPVQRERPQMLSIAENLNLAVRLGSELALLAAVSHWAWRTVRGRARLAATVAAPLAVATVWATVVHGTGPVAVRLGTQVLLFAVATGAL